MESVQTWFCSSVCPTMRQMADALTLPAGHAGHDETLEAADAATANHDHIITDMGSAP